MKNLFLLLFIVFFSAGTHAQNDSEIQNIVPTELRSNFDNHIPDGYMLKDGIMMRVKNGTFSKMEREITLLSGVVILNNGTYTRSGGNRIKFKEGEHMDMTGKITMKQNTIRVKAD